MMVCRCDLPQAVRHSVIFTPVFKLERFSVRIFLNLILVLAVSILGSGCKESEPQAFRSTDVTGANFAGDFHLTDHHGQPRTLSSFKGKVIVLFFGYIHCPDICPTTLADLASAMERLGADADKVQVLFATLDPERDTPEVLAKFVPSFNSKFIGLYGTPDEIAKTATEYKLVYNKQPGNHPGNYTLDHSAGTYIYDPAGRLRLYASYGQGADALAEDIRLLLEI